MEAPVDAPGADDEPFFLWREHVPALELWFAVQTQWRHGFDGATGLDYAGCELPMRLRGLRGRKHRERFAELQIMERATLYEWARGRGRGAAR